MYLLNETHALQSLYCNVLYNDSFWVINDYECVG